MALSAAERKRRQLEREDLARRRRPDSTYEYLSTPFYKHISDDGADWSAVALPFELMGVEPPEFTDDRGPTEAASPDALPPPGDDGENGFEGFEGSIGRAEAMVGSLITAAVELSGIINRFKRDELNKYLSELETRDLSDQAARAQALKDAVRIAAIKDELSKNVRWTFPQWKVKLE